MSYTAFTLDHFASGGGTTAVFRAGLTAQSHQWDIKAQSGSLLAHTARYHRGRKFARAFWKFWNVIGMGAGDDIHVELVGAQGVQLGRATTGNWPAVVTVTDAAGRQVVRSKRKKDTVTVYDRDDQRAERSVAAARPAACGKRRPPCGSGRRGPTSRSTPRHTTRTCISACGASCSTRSRPPRTLAPMPSRWHCFRFFAD